MKFSIIAATTAALALTSLSAVQAAEPVKVFASKTKGDHSAQNTLDGDLSTRWNAKGEGEFIQYKFAEPTAIESLNIAFFKGDKRSVSFKIESTESPWGATPNWQTHLATVSDKTTDELQTYTLSEPVTATYFRIVGYGFEGNWGWSGDLFSISDVEFIDEDTSGGDIIAEICDVSASIEHDLHTAAKAVDNNLASRWSGLGIGANLTLELCEEADISGVKAAWLKGDESSHDFSIEVSTDNTTWTEAIVKTASASDTLELQKFSFEEELSAKYIRYTGYGNGDSNWNSVTEFSACQGDECASTVVPCEETNSCPITCEETDSCDVTVGERILRYGHGFSAPNDFTDAEIELIANSYDIFTVEKRSGYKDFGPQPNSEAATKSTAARLKAINPDIKVLLYWNAVMSYEGLYESNEEFAQHDDWVHSVWTTGQGNAYDIYDLNNPDVREWWVRSITEVVTDGNLDGVFLDAGPKADASGLDQGFMLGMDAVRESLGDDKMVVYNGFRVPKEGVMQAGPNFLEHATGIFVELFFTAPQATKGAGADMLDAILEIEDDKMIILRCSPGWGDSETKINFSFAAYLLAYGPKTYFLANWGYEKDEGMFTHFPEFDLVPGKPLGDAKRNGYVYTREFENLSVTLDVEARTASIVEK